MTTNVCVHLNNIPINVQPRVSGLPPDVGTCGRDLLPFRHKSFTKIQQQCWVIGSGSQSAFQFIPKVWDEVEIRTLCRPVKFFPANWENNFFMELALYTGALSCRNRKETNTIC